MKIAIDIEGSQGANIEVEKLPVDLQITASGVSVIPQLSIEHFFVFTKLRLVGLNVWYNNELIGAFIDSPTYGDLYSFEPTGLMELCRGFSCTKTAIESPGFLLSELARDIAKSFNRHIELLRP